MLLETEFHHLPLTFQGGLLQEELAQFSENDWLPHPLGYAGVYQIPLVIDRKQQGNSVTAMRATKFLKSCPYICQTLASFGSVIGRTHLVRYKPEEGANTWMDLSYYWKNHVRVHVPIITSDKVQFRCGKKRVHMAAGEAWALNSWKAHQFEIEGGMSPVHLVIGVSGSSYLWNLDTAGQPQKQEESAMVWHTGEARSFDMERYAALCIRTPDQMDLVANELLHDVSVSRTATIKALEHLELTLAMLKRDWRNNWLIHGRRREGDKRYQFLIQHALDQVRSKCRRLELASNGVSVYQVLELWFSEILKDIARQPS